MQKNMFALATGTGTGYQFDRRSTASLSSGLGEVCLGRDKVPA